MTENHHAIGAIWNKLIMSFDGEILPVGAGMAALFHEPLDYPKRVKGCM